MGEGWWADTPTSMLPGISRKRKVRSKFWWFTGFCNSHYVSHFAAFFIDVGAKTSVAESCIEFPSVRGAGFTLFIIIRQNHAEYAALDFSVSQWRQIELVWVQKVLDWKKDKNKNEGRRPPGQVETTLLLCNWLFGLTVVCPCGLLIVFRMILPQVHLR